MDITKIQVGEILLNKTKKYLSPCLNAFGKDFEIRFDSVWKVAMGIGDILTINSEEAQFDKHIFILIDTNQNLNTSNNFRDWLLEQEDIYANDYAFDHIRNGNLHMLVIKIPEQYSEAFNKFKVGEYSKMYTIEEARQLFRNKPSLLKVVIKDHSYKIEFSKQLKELYDVNILPETIDDTFEYDLPPYLAEEFFNDHLNR